MAVINSPSSGNGAEVTTNNELKVIATNNSAVRMFSENDAGTITGSATLMSPETSPDYRLRVGTDTMLLNENFNATTQNTSTWSYTFATMTAAQPGAGTVNFSNVQGTTNAHGAFMRTFQYFPLIGTSALAVEFIAGVFTAPLVTNEIWLMGLGLPSAATTPPTDGVWLKCTSAGWTGVLIYNNVTTETGILWPAASIVLSDLQKWTILVNQQHVEFWRNDELLGEITIPAANGQPFLTGSLPVFMHKYNTGAVSNTNTMRVSGVCVSALDLQTNLPYAHQQALAGGMAYQGQNGFTMGSTAGVPTITSGSSAAPTSAAGSNTAANVTGLGGNGAINAAASAATDFIATSYQVPAGTINITARNLVITGVRISSMNNGAAVATTPTTLQWSIGFGHTAVSMATTESASFATGTTKAPRRIFLGYQSAAVGTAIGGLYSPDIVVDFTSAPIVVAPGQFINTHVKQIIGTATASQTICYTVTFMGYFV